jgi:hypothetical protein
MATKVKTFLHPIIRSNSNDYTDDSYFNAELTAEISSEVKDSIRITYSINLKNKYIEKLISNNIASVYLNLYCADTVYRRSFLVNQNKGEFTLSPGEVIGALEIEPIILNNLEIEQFSPTGLNQEFGSNLFQIEAGSPLALGEKDIFYFAFAERSLQDLIRVQTSSELNENEYEISLTSNVITIIMGTNVRKAWDFIRSDSTLRPYLYMSIYKDTFVEALAAVVNGDGTDEFLWAQKLREKFEENNFQFTDSNDFSKINMAVLRRLGSRGIETVAKNVQ